MNSDLLQSMQSILHRYFNGITHSLDSERGLVTEHLYDKNQNTEARLLCQTRSIYFLVKYSELFGCEEALSYALKLYQNCKQYYFQPLNAWQDTLNSTTPTKNLYEWAFIGFSLSALYKASNNNAISQDAVASFSYLKQQIERKEFFPGEVKYNGFVSQNPLMHLFESFALGFHSFHDVQYASCSNQLLLIIAEHFFSPTQGKIYEVVCEDISSQWSEPGHAFEWVSLLLEANQFGIKNHPGINSQQLLSVAEKQGVSQDGFVKTKFEYNETIYRIWPQLERIRTLYEAGNTKKGENALLHTLHHFFNTSGDPIEYVDQNQTNQKNTNLHQPVKSTTGYHIINCFACVLDKVKAN